MPRPSPGPPVSGAGVGNEEAAQAAAPPEVSTVAGEPGRDLNPLSLLPDLPLHQGGKGLLRLRGQGHAPGHG